MNAPRRVQALSQPADDPGQSALLQRNIPGDRLLSLVGDSQGTAEVPVASVLQKASSNRTPVVGLFYSTSTIPDNHGVASSCVPFDPLLEAHKIKNNKGDYDQCAAGIKNNGDETTSTVSTILTRSRGDSPSGADKAEIDMQWYKEAYQVVPETSAQTGDSISQSSLEIRATHLAHEPTTSESIQPLYYYSERGPIYQRPPDQFLYYIPLRDPHYERPYSCIRDTPLPQRRSDR